LLITDYWLLITGYWLLITGYWLLITEKADGHKKLTLDRERIEFSQFRYFTVNPAIRLNAL
ncbi:MAG: hypothetical protein ACKO7A_06685, partial [Microcystis sp.]